MDVEIGARIRIRRRWLGLSQTQLGDALGITFAQVQKYERGVNRLSASMLVRAAAKLETTVAALVGENEGSVTEAIVQTQLGILGATDLLAAYAAVKEGEARRALLRVAEALADPRRSRAASSER